MFRFIGRWFSAASQVFRYQAVSPDTAPALSAKPKNQSIISKGLFDILIWNIWTVLALTGTAIVLWLNFTEFTIGGEIGKSSKATADIMGALQLAIKVHEMVIVASLVAIAQQLILEGLMNRGILFGLLGAESVLADPSFVISSTFRTAIVYGLPGILPSRVEDRARRMHIFFLVGTLAVMCAICSLAGPASGVLMLPRIDWFLDKGNATRETAFFFTYPNFIIDTKLESNGNGQTATQDPFGPSLWSRGQEMDYWTKWVPVQLEQETHIITVLTKINTTTTWGRKLGAESTGGTRSRAVMWSDMLDVERALDLHGFLPFEDWKRRKYVVERRVMDLWTVCKDQLKQECGNTSNFDWCYQSGDLQQSSQDLLLLNGTNANKTRIWMTEGPRWQKNPNFSESIDIILEYPRNSWNSVPLAPSTVTICSTSGVIRTGSVTGYTVFTAEEVDYFDYEIDGAGKHQPPRTLLIQDKRMDNIHTLWDSPQPEVYPPRSAAKETNSSALQIIAAIGQTFVAQRMRCTSQGRCGEWGQEAAALEIPIGGCLAFLLSRTGWTMSQYSIQGPESLPESLRPEPVRPLEFTGYKPLVEAYNEGWGYRLSSRTSFLGITVLIAHAVIAILASLRQILWKRSVIQAWSSIPEYTALGIATVDRIGAFEHSCGGLTGKVTEGNIVKVGQTTPEDLELEVLESNPRDEETPLPTPVEKGKDVTTTVQERPVEDIEDIERPCLRPLGSGESESQVQAPLDSTNEQVQPGSGAPAGGPVASGDTGSLAAHQNE